MKTMRMTVAVLVVGSSLALYVAHARRGGIKRTDTRTGFSTASVTRCRGKRHRHSQAVIDVDGF